MMMIWRQILIIFMIMWRHILTNYIYDEMTSHAHFNCIFYTFVMCDLSVHSSTSYLTLRLEARMGSFPTVRWTAVETGDSRSPGVTVTRTFLRCRSSSTPASPGSGPGIWRGTITACRSTTSASINEFNSSQTYRHIPSVRQTLPRYIIDVQ